MGRKTQQQADITKDTILQTTLEIIYAKGYARSTFIDIAEKIKLSKGAIYHHFKNKPELFLALGMHMEGKIDTALQEMIIANPSIDELQKILYEIIRIIAEDPQLRKYYTIVFHRMEWTEELQSTMDYFNQSDDEMRAYILGIFNKAKAKKILVTGINTEQATQALMALFNGLLSHCLLETKLSGKHQLAIVETGLNIYFQGLKAN